MKQLTKKLAKTRNSDLMMIYTRCQQHERLTFRKLHPTPQASKLSNKMQALRWNKIMKEIEGNTA